jgi:hypothetical protein
MTHYVLLDFPELEGTDSFAEAQNYKIIVSIRSKRVQMALL